jgi:two-component system response regulator PilR (NtrC family)
MNKPLALIVDDEADIRDLLSITLARMGIESRTAATIAEANRQLGRDTFDLCLTDMGLPDGSGIDLVGHINSNHPTLPVAMITAHGSMESAVAAMKAGAFDFVSKPLDLNLLRQLVESALRLREPTRHPTADHPPAAELLGGSRQMAEIRRLIAKLARNQAPVFISGESGTGKELAARLIHVQGPRADRAFVPVNCGAIPQDLVESELFGHMKGSFTGAVADKMGLFVAADGGTLFLDEIADLPLPMQVKLLRAIQEKSIRPVGAQREISVDTRIISASHRNLAAEVARNAFRQDLFYRINVIELHLPALRERPEDIRPLAEHILSRMARDGRRTQPLLTEDALTVLEAYAFPGNVRELENILERAVTLSDSSTIDAEDILLPRADVAERTTKPAPVEPHTSGEVPLEHYLDEVERSAILKALEETRWNRTAAARKLGMTLRSLRYRLAKLGLD